MMVADSDVLVDFLRGAGQAERIAYEIKSGSLYTTAVSAFELWAGAKPPQQAATVETLLAALTILPLDSPSAKNAGEIRRELEAKKNPIGMADSLIAGICRERDAVLITRNKKHFERVPGLKLSGRYEG